MIHFQYGIPQSSSQLLASRQHQAPPSLDWGLWKLQVFCYVTDPRVRRLCVCVGGEGQECQAPKLFTA